LCKNKLRVDISLNNSKRMPSLRVLPVGNPIAFRELPPMDFPGLGDVTFEVLNPILCEQALKLVHVDAIDCVLLAFGAASKCDLSLLREVAKSPRPIMAIVVSGEYDAAAAAACLRGGAQDYLCLQGLTSGELVRAILHARDRLTARRQEAVLAVEQFALREESAERIRVEKELVETVERYRFLLDCLPQIVWTADPKGTLVYINDYWVQYSGRSIQSTLIEGWETSIHPDDLAMTRERQAQSIIKGEPFEFQYRLCAKNGSYRWHELRSVPRRSSSGAILEWIGTEADIDDEKRVEERLKEAHDELGIRILERTSELAHANELLKIEVVERRRAEEEAQKAREVAEAANSSKTEFLANISHEIRTPMNGIIGMTELALESELDLQQRECLQLVAHSADSLLVLINDMLDFAKIEAGRMELESEPFALRPMLEDVVKSMSVRAGQKGNRLVVEVRSDVPAKVIGDSVRLRQVMINLLGNAIKFTEKGEIGVWVSAIAAHEDRIDLLFEVTDTGIGIPEDKQGVIFEAFAQVDGSMTRRFGGTGLGLAIVSNLVKQMGGDIRVESKLGEGSTFSFNLPTRVEYSEEPTSDGFVVEADTERYDGMRVLIVAEQRSSTATTLVEMLKSMHLESRVIGLGEEALGEVERAQCRGQAYRLIIADASLGDMSGEQFVHALVKGTELKAPVVLLLAGTASTEEVKKAWAAEPDWILYKPVIQADLLETIERSLLMVEPVDMLVAKSVSTHKIGEAKPPLRVLIAEDNMVNQLVAERILMSFGCSIVKVNNGREAVEAVERELFDLLLMDIQMPEMDGVEATRMIRSFPDERANLPIVAMTAHAMKGDRERFLAAGLDHYISKPFHKDELLLLVKSISARTRRESHAVGSNSKAVWLNRFLKAMGNDKTLFRGACDLFAELMPGRVLELGAALEGHRAQDAERLARNLKASLDSVGVRETSERITVMEANLRSRDFPGALAFYERIQKDISEILAEILVAREG